MQNLSCCTTSVHSFISRDIKKWRIKSLVGHSFSLLAMDDALKIFILMRIRWKQYKNISEQFLNYTFEREREKQTQSLFFWGKVALLQISSLFYDGIGDKTVSCWCFFKIHMYDNLRCCFQVSLPVYPVW